MKKLGFGMMRLPVTDPEDKGSIDLGLVCKMVDEFMKEGFTYIDTVYPYHQGLSEGAVKKALVERYPRNAFLLADKMPTFSVNSPEDYPRFFAEQLERCGVEYFDYYLLHNLGEQNYASTLKHNGFSFMKRVKAEGKAKHIGFSYHDKAELLDRILTDHPEMEFVQLQINYIDWDSESVEARKCYEVAVKHGKPVIVMEPVKGGSLAKVPEEAERLFKGVHPDWSVASWGVRFAASLENVMVVLSGMSSYEQLVDNISYMKEFTTLTDTEQKTIDKAVDIINAGIAVPCTGCRYCVDGCPQNISIPELFSLYNTRHQFPFSALNQKTYYGNLILKSGKAADCIACGQCEEHCPQHIAIIERLKEVSKVFDGE